MYIKDTSIQIEGKNFVRSVKICDISAIIKSSHTNECMFVLAGSSNVRLIFVNDEDYQKVIDSFKESFKDDPP